MGTKTMTDEEEKRWVRASDILMCKPHPERLTIPSDKPGTLPIARIFRLDGQPRRHYPKCPTYPGEPLSENAICADCIYGVLAGRPL